jgi:Carboxypeptidase regulatory-like domain
MTAMMRLQGRCFRWLLPAAAVLATVSCGTGAPGTNVPAGPAAPGTTATPARSATAASSATPATATRSPGATAVIFGVVKVGPSCPADRVFHACRPHPLANVEVQARSPGTGVVASARTGTDGHYSLRLRPGSYQIVVVIAQIVPRCPRVPVSVRSGAAARSDIKCDSGIRTRGPPGTNPA